MLANTGRVLRLSAGAIVIERGALLLVRHGSSVHGQDFLVAPGGGVEGDESVAQTVVRETKEETGLNVQPGKLLFVEDMISSRKRVVKFWFLCSVIAGELLVSTKAAIEGVVEARWYTKSDIKARTVFPSVLLDTDWQTFFDDRWQTTYFENRDADASF